MTAIADADVCLFMIDAREGVTAADEIVAEAATPRRQAGGAGGQQMRRPPDAMPA